MNKPSKCKNCQWYGKPYWSIINPCDNCPMEKNNVEVFTTWIDPTIKEKDKEIERLNKIINHLVYHIYYHEEVDELFEQVFKLALGKQFIKVLPIEEQIDIEELKEKSDKE